jgi:ketosteroid isomerase-like protein
MTNGGSMVTTTTPKAEFLELERRFWDALKQKDAHAAVELTDFPCLVTGAQGVGRIEREAFTKMVQSDAYTIKDAKLSDLDVRLVRDDVAIVAYKVHEELTVDGKPVTFDAADLSTWVRSNGEWRCAAHTEAIIGDPYGRDRT